MTRTFAIAAAAALLALSLVGGATQDARADAGSLKTYVVVFKGDYALDGSFVMDASYALGPGYALGNNYALVHDYALGIVKAAGGAVTSDLSKQIGVMVVASANETFVAAMRQYALVDEVSEDYSWKASESYQEAVRNGTLTVVQPSGVPGGGPDPTADPLESLQWNMDAIDAPEAHEIQAGARAVEVGILDSGIDGQHQDFLVDSTGPNPNVNCAKGRDFVAIGPGVGNPDPCVDNQFHGTHVAGIVASRTSSASSASRRT
jgi:subtilisin family serine protease